MRSYGLVGHGDTAYRGLDRGTALVPARPISLGVFTLLIRQKLGAARSTIGPF